jgi:hypothetical protein
MTYIYVYTIIITISKSKNEIESGRECVMISELCIYSKREVDFFFFF